MNPVFLAKLSPQNSFDNNGRFQLASTTSAPGALPRVANAPGSMPRATTVVPPAASAEAPTEPAAASSAPVAVASVPMPRTAPQPKQGEAPANQPTTIAGLIGTWFSGSKSEADSSTHEQVAARTADLAAKPKQAPAAPVRTASAGASVPLHTTAPTHAPAAPAAKAREAAPKAAPAPASSPWPAPPQPAKTEPQPQQSEIRTAYSTPPASNNGLLTGAQPVVPAGSFNSFR
jgi:hypothetical protein